MVQGANTFAFGYNGLGDRLRQTVNGAPTTYTLDLAAGLTQVLSDGTTTYLYGLGRVGEQQPAGWQYHLGDALGSVRQLADASGAVALAQGYEPYGETLTSAGSGVSVFQFAGEQRDGTGLTYLRARYVEGGVGRFISRDPWGGDPTRPLSYNAWLYAYANPTNLTDPSGLCPAGARPNPDGTCTFTIPLSPFGVTVEGGEISIDLPGWLADWLCSNQSPLQPAATATATPRSATPTPQLQVRNPVRVQLQEGFATHAAIALPDLGGGVTVAQVVGALTVLRASPAIPKRHQRGADVAYAAAVRWVESRPPYGVWGKTARSFQFPTDPNWRFDLEVLVGPHLQR